MRRGINRVVTLILSDNHYGSDIKPEQTGGLAYGKKEEAAATKYVVQEACDFKKRYRGTTGLQLLLGGDTIRGKIHDKEYCLPLSEQIERARKNYQAALDALCAAYPVVVATGLTGNHDRRSDSHPSRATIGRSDSHATDIYRSLKVPKNCKLLIPETPYAQLDVFGHKFLATHGDGMLKIANPGKSVSVAKLEAQINRWGLSRWKPDVVILGHHHIPLITVLPTRTRLIVNGSTMPADEYGMSIDYPATPCAQVLFESTAEHAVGDVRIIDIPDSVYGG